MTFNWLEISLFCFKSHVLGCNIVFWGWNLCLADPKTCSGGYFYCWCKCQQPCWHIFAQVLARNLICLFDRTSLCFLQALVLLANFGKNWTHTSYANENIYIFCYILMFILKYLLLNCFALNVYNSLVFFACPKTDIFVGKHFVFVNLYISYIQFDYPLSWPKHSYVIIRSGDNS